MAFVQGTILGIAHAAWWVGWVSGPFTVLAALNAERHGRQAARAQVVQALDLHIQGITPGILERLGALHGRPGA